MVPVIGLRRGSRVEAKLVELWIVSPVLNIVGGTILILIVTTHGVLPARHRREPEDDRRPCPRL